MHQDYSITHLKQLESEAIYILRETAAQFERPVLLFSGGKDSIVMAHLAKKAFYPARLPFPLMHVDTGHNFTETMEYRDRFIADLGAELVVASVQEAIDAGKVKEETGPHASRNGLQTVALLDGLNLANMMLRLAVGDVMKKRRVLKSVFSPTEMRLGNGILRISVRNCGIFSTAASIMESTSVFSRSAIGLKWIYGNTSNWKPLIFLAFISPMSVLVLSGMG